jgi:hypothetical protein
LNANRDDVYTLYIKASHDEKKLGIVAGKRLVRGMVEITEIFIYRRDRRGKWILEKQMEFEFDDYTCEKFSFDKKDSNVLIFFTATEIFRFDYTAPDGHQEKTLYTM